MDEFIKSIEHDIKFAEKQIENYKKNEEQQEKKFVFDVIFLWETRLDYSKELIERYNKFYKER